MQPFQQAPMPAQPLPGAIPENPNDFTAKELNDPALGNVTGFGVNAAFFYQKVELYGDDGKPNGQSKDVLCVAKAIVGDFKTIATKRITEEQAKIQFPREYKAFTENQAMPVNGTPLSELPGITQSQIGRLAVNHVYSIEQAASLNEATINNLGLEAKKVAEHSKRWLENRDDGAELKDQSEELAELRAQVERLTELNQKSEQTAREQQIALDTLRQSQGQAVQAGLPNDPTANQGVRLESSDDFDYYGGDNPLAQGPDDGSEDDIPGEVEETPLGNPLG